MTQKAKHLWQWFKSTSTHLTAAYEPKAKSNMAARVGFYSEQERARARLERMKRSIEQRLPLI